MSVFNTKIKGLENLELNSKFSPKKVYKDQKADFNYSEEVIQAVRDSGISFVAYTQSGFKDNNFNKVTSDVVADRMVQYNLENNNMDKYYSIGNICYNSKSIDSFDSEDVKRASFPVLFISSETLPEDSIIPSVILCAFGWGVERINKPYASIFVQDFEGSPSFVSIHKWNYKINYESVAERAEIIDLRLKHEEQFLDENTEYEFGVGDIIKCCYPLSEGTQSYRIKDVCAKNIQKFMDSFSPNPFIAYFKRTLKKTRTIIWAKIYNDTHGYKILSFNEEKKFVIVEDCNGYTFPVKWMTWHPALQFESFKDYVKSLKEKNQSEESELDASAQCDEIFNPMGVTPLK